MLEKSKLDKILCVFIVVMGVLIIGLRSTVLISDSLWHIRIGEYIVDNGIPHTTPFSIHENLSFMAHEWMYDVFVFGIDSLFGYKGLVVVSALICIIGFSIMVFYDKENRLEKSFLVFLFAFFGFSKDILAIPDTIGSILIIASNFVWLSKLDIKKKVLLNVIFTIAIVNVHGGALTSYFVQICLFLFVDMMYVMFAKERAKWLDFVLLLGTSFIAGLLNPYGIKVYAYAYKMLSADIAKYMVDWQPYQFRGIGPILVFIFCIIFMFAGNKNLSELRKADVQRYGIVFLWIMMMFTYQRCINLVCYSIIAFAGSWIAFGLKGILRLFKFEKICLIVFFVLVCVLGVAFMDKHGYSSTKDYVYDTSISEAAAECLSDKDIVLFNHTNLGGALIYLNLDTYMDGRTDPYMKSFNGVKDIVSEHLRALYYPDYMQTLVKEYGFTDILLENNTVSSELYKQAGYEEVYSDSRIIIFKAKK